MGREAPTLFERGPELERLRETRAGARAGVGSVVVVEGPAGVGKTALLAAAREEAEREGLAALGATAPVLEGEIAWGAVRRLLAPALAADAEALLGGAAAHAAGPLGLSPEPAGAGALHGLYWLIAGLAERAPLQLALDDAHWADEPSLRFLAYLAERLSDLPVALVLGVRSGEEQPPPLRALLAAPDTQVIALRELSPAASAALTRARLGATAADEFCAACHQASGGNPFLLRELTRELRREGVEPSAERRGEVAAATPASVIRAVGLRLARLPEPARELAAAVAIFGGGADLRQAAELAGLEPEEAEAAADALAAAGILAPEAPPRFAHPLVAEVVYGALPPFRRGRRHRRAAALLAAGGSGDQRVATQLLATPAAGDPWVVERLREAAAAALGRAAPQTAADLLERALAEPPAEAERGEILAGLGCAELAAGRPDPSCEHLGEAVRLIVEPRDRARAALDHGRALYLTGRPMEGAAAFERGHVELTEAGIDDPSLGGELRAAWLAVARTELPLRARAAALAREVSADPPRGDSYGERALLAQVAGELTFAAEPRDRALELSRAALADGELIAQETSDGLNWIAAMGALGWGDDFDAYDELQRLAQADARRRGSVIGLVNGSYGLSFSHYYRGLLASAAASAWQAIEAESDGWVFFLPAARAHLSWSLIERGELDAALAQLEMARDDVAWPASAMQALVYEAKARLHLALAEPGLALDAALAAGRIFEEALVENPSIAPWRARAAVAAARLGRVDQAEALLEESLRRARRFGAPRPIGVTLLAAGQVRRRRAGLEALEEAVEVLADSPARLEYARALVFHGAALRRAGRAGPARERLLAGLDLAASLGAAPLAERAREELRAAGARPRRERLSGAASLTPAQLRVAELAVQGLSNREIAEALFVSRRTVETHLTQAYRKLDIASRAELEEALRGGGEAG
jgi:DNA-binding CsgD family transcriptional regulator